MLMGKRQIGAYMPPVDEDEKDYAPLGVCGILRSPTDDMELEEWQAVRCDGRVLFKGHVYVAEPVNPVGG